MKKNEEKINENEKEIAEFEKRRKRKAVSVW